MCETEREREREIERERKKESGLLGFGREVIPILWVTLLRGNWTPLQLHISPSHVHTHTHTHNEREEREKEGERERERERSFHSSLFKGKTLPRPRQREELQWVITLVSSCPPPPPPPLLLILLSHQHLVTMAKCWQLLHLQAPSRLITAQFRVDSI